MELFYSTILGCVKEFEGGFIEFVKEVFRDRLGAAAERIHLQRTQKLQQISRLTDVWCDE